MLFSSFIVSRTENECSTSRQQDKDCEQKKDTQKTEVSETSKDVVGNFEGSHSLQNDIPNFENKIRMGPVVRLPVDTKIVMRVDAPGGVSSYGEKASNKGTSSCHRAGKKEDLAAKIDQV